MRITNTTGLPQGLVDAIAHDDYDRGECDYTVTELLTPPQILKLKLEHEELAEDASMRVWALLGKAVSSMIERPEGPFDPDKRIYRHIDIAHPRKDMAELVCIGGKMNRCLVDAGLLQDYKVVTTYEWNSVRPERVQQLNIYRWLLEGAGVEIEELELVYIFRDWQIGKAENNHPSYYPKRQVMRVPVELWSMAKTEAFIRTRILDHRHGLACTAEDRWESPGKWAVYKYGNKRATKLFEFRKHAEEWCDENETIVLDGESVPDGATPTHYMRFRPGLQQRCRARVGLDDRSYCPVSSVCPQWSEMRWAGHLDIYGQPAEEVDT